MLLVMPAFTVVPERTAVAVIPEPLVLLTVLSEIVAVSTAVVAKLAAESAPTAMPRLPSTLLALIWFPEMVAVTCAWPVALTSITCPTVLRRGSAAVPLPEMSKFACPLPATVG